MKRPFSILSLVAFAAIILLPSCKNCWACYKGASKAMVCRNDYSTAQEFEGDMTMYRNAGYTCE